MDIKNAGVIVLKNAVNAVALSGCMSVMMSGTFNFHSIVGWENIGRAALAAVVARELAVWGPIVMKWSVTNADPSLEVVKTPPGQPDLLVVKPTDPKL